MASENKPKRTPTEVTTTIATREELLKGLQEDLSREYQAIMAYVVYSQALKGAAYQSIAKELEVHAGEELAHAITIASRLTISAACRTPPRSP